MIKKFTLLLLPVFFIVINATAQPPRVPATKGTNFGEKVTAADAVSPDKLPEILKEKQTAEVKLKGKVIDVCKSRGCFIYMKTSKGKVYIKTKDDAFFVPLALNGKTVVVQGIASIDNESKEISVDATGILVM